LQRIKEADFNMIEWKRIKSTLENFFDKFGDDQTITLAAALSYYAIFSIPPILILIINTSGFFLGEPKVQEALYSELSQVMGREGIDQIRESVNNSGLLQATFFRTMINVLILVFTATTVFATTQKSLNLIFRVKSKPRIGALEFFKIRAISFVIILGISLVLIISLIANALIGAFVDYIVQWTPGLDDFAIEVTTWIFQLIVTTILVAMLFRFLPDVRLKWKDTWVGAGTTAILFALGRYGIGFYISQSGAPAIYEAAGAVVVLLIWVFFTSIIFFFGAQITYAFATRKGNRIVPSKQAVRYKHVELTIDDE